MSTGPLENKVIIYFDGVCNLCNHVVDFFIRRDKNDIFRFCSLQSEIAQKRLPSHLLDPESLNTVVVEYQGQYWSKSKAVIKALQMLGGVYSIFFIALLVPKRLSNFIYDYVASHRYNWFGKRQTCRVPNINEKNKFL